MGIYALVAAGFMALAGIAYGLYERADAATAAARADTAEHDRDRFKSDLKDSEKDKAELKARNQELDAIVKARDVRVKGLEDEKRRIKSELDGVRASLPQADQDCLNRSLPDALAIRLLDDGTVGSQGNGAGAHPGDPHISVPEVIPPR